MCNEVNDDQAKSGRRLTLEELGSLVVELRSSRKWSQETLADLAKLSVRTIQRVERGDSTDLDTRRALASAFDLEIDYFEGLFTFVTEDEMKAAETKLASEYVTLQPVLIADGRQLVTLFEASNMNSARFEASSGGAVEAAFARMVDYLRDYNDAKELYSEVDRLEVVKDIHNEIEELRRGGVSVCCATRAARLTSPSWPNPAPITMNIIYLLGCNVGREPKTMLVSKAVQLR